MNQPTINAGGTLLARSQSPYWNPFNPQNRRDPYAMYAQLRRHDPVHQTSANDWVATSYVDICSVLTDKRFEVVNMPDYFNQKTLIQGDRVESFEPIYQATYRWLLYTTRPTHPRLRELVMRIWPSLDFDGCVAGVMEDLANALRTKVQPDLVDDLAKRVPALIMTRLLGFPEEQVDNLQCWSEQLANILEPMLTRSQLLTINQAAIDFMALIDQTVADHEQHPRPTLTGQLIELARQERYAFERSELLSLINNLFVAGGETTRNLIGNGCYLLTKYPDQRERIKQDPTLLKPAVEEMLRYESPVQLTSRVALEDVVLAGRLIRAGQQVYLCLASANRDEQQFDQADVFDITRQKNKHLAFGHGSHFCLGSQLAKSQSMAAFQMMLDQFGHLQVDLNRVVQRRNLLLRGFVSLPTLP